MKSADEQRSETALKLNEAAGAAEEMLTRYLSGGDVSREEMYAVRDGLQVALNDASRPDLPPEGYIVPEGDERCDYIMDACTCMKRKGHDGMHACAHGGWR